MPAKKPKAKPKPAAKKKLLKPDEYGLTALSRAVIADDLKALRKVLEGGADPNVGNGERITPLYMAAVTGHADAVELLLRHGADPNLVDANDTAALQLAAYIASGASATDDRRRVVELLLAHGADPDHRNKAGATPRKLARVMGNPEVKKLFAAVKRRPAKTPGPGRRSQTYAELTGTVDEGYYWTRHERLWDALVPPSGQAKTVQGELIRITGKLTREAYTNGNMNWDRDCTRLWNFVAHVLDDPSTFSEAERADIRAWVKQIIRDRTRPDTSGEGSPYDRVSEKAVQWVEAHPKPIRHVPDPTIGR